MKRLNNVINRVNLKISIKIVQIIHLYKRQIGKIYDEKKEKN